MAPITRNDEAYARTFLFGAAEAIERAQAAVEEGRWRTAQRQADLAAQWSRTASTHASSIRESAQEAVSRAES